MKYYLLRQTDLQYNVWGGKMKTIAITVVVLSYICIAGVLSPDADAAWQGEYGPLDIAAYCNDNWENPVPPFPGEGESWFYKSVDDCISFIRKALVWDCIGYEGWVIDKRRCACHVYLRTHPDMRWPECIIFEPYRSR